MNRNKNQFSYSEEDEDTEIGSKKKRRKPKKRSRRRRSRKEKRGGGLFFTSKKHKKKSRKNHISARSKGVKSYKGKSLSKSIKSKKHERERPDELQDSNSVIPQEYQTPQDFVIPNAKSTPAAPNDAFVGNVPEIPRPQAPGDNAYANPDSSTTPNFTNPNSFITANTISEDQRIATATVTAPTINSTVPLAPAPTQNPTPAAPVIPTVTKDAQPYQELRIAQYVKDGKEFCQWTYTTCYPCGDKPEYIYLPRIREYARKISSKKKDIRKENYNSMDSSAEIPQKISQPSKDTKIDQCAVLSPEVREKLVLCGKSLRNAKKNIQNLEILADENILPNLKHLEDEATILLHDIDKVMSDLAERKSPNLLRRI